MSSQPTSPDPIDPDLLADDDARDRPESRRDENALRLQDIARQLASLAQKERRSAPPPAYPAPASRFEEEEAFMRLLERVDDNERQTVEALTAVNERLTMLGQQLALLPRTAAPTRPEDVPGYSTLESAIRNVIEHIEVSERRTRESLKSMQDRLGELAAEALRPADAEDAQRTGPILSSLEARVAEISNRLLRTESVLQAGVPDAVRKELGQISERIESVKSSADQIMRQAQSTAVGAARSELREIEARVLSMLKEAQANTSAQPSALPEVSQLRSEIGGLSRRVDEIRTAAATDRDLNALRLAVEQLSTRVAQGPDMRPLAEMERRLGDIARRVDQIAAAPAGAGRIEGVEARLAELGQRIEHAMALQGDPQAFAQLEENIAAVSERVGRTEQQLAHIETMEHAIRQLYESLAQSREAMAQTAEEAANRVAERLMAGGLPAIGPSPELRALEDGLRAVRESAAGAEQRNQETLAAVHETLSQIVEKIAELESGPRGAPGSFSAPPDPYRSAMAGAEAQASAAATTPLSAGDDFIAAARRAAAQAAAVRPSDLRANVTAAAVPAQDDGGFSLFKRFRAGAQPVQRVDRAFAPRVGAQATPDGAKRRRLLLAGVVLLAAVSAFAFSMLATRARAPEMPAATQQPGAPGPDSNLLPGKAGANLITGSLAPQAAIAMPPAAAGTAALRAAAVAGDPRAQFLIASHYVDGEGIAKDEAIAAQWFHRAADQGLAPAQYRLGTQYERGLGVPQDARTALGWYEKAAAQGNVNAMHNGAVILSGGIAGVQDYAKALSLFTKAAAHGLRDSQFNLAVMHERGLGTNADVVEAYVWYRLAGQQGDTQAAARADTIAKSLGPKELGQLATRLAGFTPEAADPAANTVTATDPAWAGQPSTVLASEAAVPAPKPPDMVAEAQALLKRMGFNIGTADGRLDNRTVTAIRLFQLRQGLAVTGQLTPEVLDAMRAKAG